jgi:hypothetical protein
MPDPVPHLNHAVAETVGCELHDRWGSLAGNVPPPFPRDALAWGDLVQFVLRKAREAETCGIADVEGAPA